MARRLNMAFLAALVIAALIQSSAAQTTHTVGDTTGWTIAQGGATFYSNWAARQTFAVGEVLVFNFVANAHDVAKVTKADYDACTTTNPILLETTSPARITINATGEHYFICNFTGHCNAGQKLMINVSAATAPAPQPSSSSSPAPQPSSVPSPQPSTPTPVSAPSPSPVSTPPPSSISAPSPSPVSTPPPSSVTPPSPSPVSTPPPSSVTPPSPSSVSPPPGSSTTPPPPTTPSSPSPSGFTAPPPPDSSARSLSITGLSATFLSIVVAFLY